ncbi:hypothetical protein MLD38_030509 [Melastoma candidum]|uniref:Uncharacterized protein n=1 Tax=Melastoma candidum TaxID=119954 RepID=A0ACB9MNE6_9MYRT|nr:hypothetical protein MLD38_030509 [Melastoma candidum]
MACYGIIATAIPALHILSLGIEAEAAICTAPPPPPTPMNTIVVYLQDFSSGINSTVAFVAGIEGNPYDFLQYGMVAVVDDKHDYDHRSELNISWPSSRDPSYGGLGRLQLPGYSHICVHRRSLRRRHVSGAWNQQATSASKDGLHHRRNRSSPVCNRIRDIRDSLPAAAS